MLFIQNTSMFLFGLNSPAVIFHSQLVLALEDVGNIMPSIQLVIAQHKNETLFPVSRTENLTILVWVSSTKQQKYSWLSEDVMVNDLRKLSGKNMCSYKTVLRNRPMFGGTFTTIKVKGVKNFKIFWMNNKAILLNSAIIDYYICIPFIYILSLGLVRVGTCV